ncbi:hypothetical protein PYW07_011976 [Mythimna separata]|uniref:Uncharacterized protein n=1 Tax=Mythimna separata TaxID=271217 RepID=A0AAD7YL95_MYTSE|nr:hypothetical protein PYW07_011976 [Mythimna separata]
MLHNVNPQISNFKAALASVPENERNHFKFVIRADRRPIRAHPGWYSAPTTNEELVLSKQTAPSSPNAPEFYDTVLYDDQDYQPCGKDALRVMVVENGGALLCGRPRPLMSFIGNSESGTTSLPSRAETGGS